MKVDGPFFIREGETYDLAPMCKDCAFGDEEGCTLKPCIYFQFDEEVE
jgi:hypothetical protein